MASLFSYIQYNGMVVLTLISLVFDARGFGGAPQAPPHAVVPSGRPEYLGMRECNPPSRFRRKRLSFLLIRVVPSDEIRLLMDDQR